MENSARFFKNTACEHYPCHRGISELNCLFCFCPLYLQDCGGNFEIIRLAHGKEIKDCSLCAFPHRTENYQKIIEKLRNIYKS